MELANLTLGNMPFDPLHPEVQKLLVTALGVSSAAVIASMDNFRGARKEGIWYVTDGDCKLVLKLVRARRAFPTELTEAESLIKLHQQYPAIANDPNVVFPCQILSIIGARGHHDSDLIVMKCAPGKQLATIVEDKCHVDQGEELIHTFELVGMCLKRFHATYGNKQHGHFQTGKIFFDESGGRITFIDLAGVATTDSDTDVDYLIGSLRTLSDDYCPFLIEQLTQSFEQGYAEAVEVVPVIRAPTQPVPLKKVMPQSTVVAFEPKLELMKGGQPAQKLGVFAQFIQDRRDKKWLNQIKDFLAAGGKASCLNKADEELEENDEYTDSEDDDEVVVKNMAGRSILIYSHSDKDWMPGHVESVSPEGAITVQYRLAGTYMIIPSERQHRMVKLNPGPEEEVLRRGRAVRPMKSLGCKNLRQRPSEV